MLSTGANVQDEAQALPIDFHDHVYVIAISRHCRFPDEFRIVSSKEHAAPILQQLESRVRKTLCNTNYWYELFNRRRTHYAIDTSHSYVLEMEFATEIYDAHMLCFSYHVCPCADKCPNGVFIQNV